MPRLGHQSGELPPSGPIIHRASKTPRKLRAHKSGGLRGRSGGGGPGPGPEGSIGFIAANVEYIEHLGTSTFNIPAGNEIVTLSLWVKPVTLPASNQVIIFNNAPNLIIGGLQLGYGFFAGQPGFFGRIYRGGASQVAHIIHVPSTNAWTFLSLSNGPTFGLQLHSFESGVTRSAAAGQFNSLQVGGEPVQIGAWDFLGSGPAVPFDGWVDEMSWHRNRELTLADKLQIYDSGNGLNRPDWPIGLQVRLDAYFNFNEPGQTFFSNEGAGLLQFVDNNIPPIIHRPQRPNLV